jgi:hypothetical protein
VLFSTRPRTLRALIPALLAVSMVGVACTGDEVTTSSDPTTSDTPLPTVDVPVAFVPGEWEYDNNGVAVTYSWDTGALTVDNRSGAELGAPGLYVVTQTQQRVDAEVAQTAPIPDGASADLMASFPPDISLEDVGLVALLFGDQNWGAMSPVIAEP